MSDYELGCAVIVAVVVLAYAAGAAPGTRLVTAVRAFAYSLTLLPMYVLPTIAFLVRRARGRRDPG